MTDKEKNNLFDRLQVNSYYDFNFKVPNYLLQGITNFLEDFAYERNKMKWNDLKKLIHLALEENEINGIQASLLEERYKRIRPRKKE